MLKLLRVMAALSLLGMNGSAAVNIHERKVGSGIKFAVTKDHMLRPMMGAQLEVIQESGPMTDGSMACDVIAREHEVVESGEKKIADETVLRCDGARVFVAKRLLFIK